MNDLPKSVTWRGQHYSFRTLGTLPRAPEAEDAWAVWHGREFIGTLPYVPGETSREFGLRSAGWFRGLIG